MSKRFTFHEGQADKVLGPLFAAYANQENIFEEYHADLETAPQHLNPLKGVVPGSVEDMRILFFRTLVTLGSNSYEGFKQATNLYHQYPEVYTQSVLEDRFQGPAQHIQSMLFGAEDENDEYPAQNELARIFKEIGLNRPNSWSKNWFNCMQTLYKYFDGNPLSVIEEYETIDDFYKEKSKLDGKFSGFGQKLFSLYLVFVAELKLDHFPISQEMLYDYEAFPVDMHVQNICLSNGIVSINDDNPRVSDTTLAIFLRKELVKYCRKNKVTIIDASHALWFQGRHRCSDCVNTDSVDSVCILTDTCDGRFDTSEYHKKGRWDLTKISRKGKAPISIDVRDQPQADMFL